jgi:hypothetical protein
MPCDSDAKDLILMSNDICLPNFPFMIPPFYYYFNSCKNM